MPCGVPPPPAVYGHSNTSRGAWGGRVVLGVGTEAGRRRTSDIRPHGKGPGRDPLYTAATPSVQLPVYAHVPWPVHRAVGRPIQGHGHSAAHVSWYRVPVHVNVATKLLAGPQSTVERWARAVGVGHRRGGGGGGGGGGSRPLWRLQAVGN